MSLVGGIRSQDQQVRHLQELTRRDETKLPTTDAVGPRLDAAPYLGVGWSPISTFPNYGCVWYYLDRDRAWVQGEIALDRSVPSADPSLPFDALPFTPAVRSDVRIFTVPNGGQPVAYDNLFWMAFVFTTGRVALETNPDPLLSDGLPVDLTWLHIDFSFRIT